MGSPGRRGVGRWAQVRWSNGKERGVGGRGRTGSVELLYRRTGATVTMDTLSEAKQGKGKQREVFDEKEMEKTNLQ